MHAIGVPIKVDRFDGAGTLMSRTETALAIRNNALPYKAQIADRIERIGEVGGLEGHGTQYTYNIFGEVTQESERAIPATAGGRRTLFKTYFVNTASYLVDTVRSDRYYVGADTSGPIQRQIRYFYDGDTTYTVPPSSGNMTRRQIYLDSESRWLTENFTYDGYGNRLTETTPLGYVTAYAYDPVFHQFAVRKELPPFAEGDARLVELASWNYTCGEPATQTDINDRQTTFTYDALCRQTEAAKPGEFVRTAYFDFGNPQLQRIKVTLPAAPGTARYTEFLFDGLRRVWRTRSPLVGADIRYVDTNYDARGNVRSTTAPYFSGASPTIYTTNLFYDALDREVLRTFPDGTSVSTAYVIPGDTRYVLRTDVTNEVGITVENFLDGFGRNGLEIVDRSGVSLITTSTFDIFDQLKTVADTFGNTVVYSYDSVGRRVRANDPDNGLWRYRHDDDGRMVRSIDAKGQNTDFAYDSLARMTQRTTLSGTPAATVLTRTYDEARGAFSNVGELTTETNDAASFSYNYNILGEVQQSTYAIGTATYSRIENFYPTHFTRFITYPDGDEIGTTADGWVHNADGGVIRAPKLIVNTQYNARGQVTNRNYANGVSLTQTYDDARGWLNQITVSNGATIVFERVFNRAANGRIASTGGATPDDRWTDTYDTAGRLIEALKRPTSQTISDTYDRINNLTFKTGYGTYTYPANGQPRPHAPTQVGTASLSYDANGSLTLSTGDPRISKAITWDGLNRIASVARGGQTVMTYAPNDSRLTRTFTPLGGTASTTTFFADMEVSPAGILTKYPVSDAKRIAFETYGVHLDHNGSVRAITDRVGTTITRLAYLPYGTETRTVIATPPVEETKGYISERYDDSTGLMDLNARYYDPRIARFVQPDMLDPNLPGVGVNRYAYALQ